MLAIGVDLGTSNTVAVVRWPDGRTRPLLADGAPVMPSGVYADEYGRLHVGRDAARLAQVDPARFEPNPKRRIDEPAVLLGDREVATVDLLAAVLAAVARSAVEVVGLLPPAVLTYPASWGQPRRDVLAAAAARAGWPPPLLVPEPVAAARYFVGVLRRPVPVGSALAVFDFGGGTLDVAVVRNEGGRFAVLGSGGLANVGGLDIDAALVDHLGTLVGPTRPELWHGLTAPDSPARRRDRRLLWDDVRGAKEMLSRVAVAPITVPGLDGAAHLTREEVERLAAPLVDRAVAETAAVISRCGLRPDALAGLFLVGGSSRLPMVARRLHTELGIAPTVLEQPELPVAEGALAELAGQPPPGAGFAAPVSPGGPSSQLGYGHPPTPAPPRDPRPPVRGRRRLVLAAVAAAVVVAVVAAAAVFFWPDRDDPVDFAALTSTKVSVPLGTESPRKTISHTIGDRAFVAWQRDDTMELAGIDLAAGKKLWQERVAGTSERWLGMLAAPKAVLVFADDSRDAAPRRMYALDPATGKERWHRDLLGGDRAILLDTALLIDSAADEVLYALDWDTGRERWRLPPRTASDRPLRTRTLLVTTDDDQRQPADFAGRPFPVAKGAGARLVQLDSERTLRVVDAATGKVRERKGVADHDDAVLAHDGRLYVLARDSGFQLRAYDLAKLGEPAIPYVQTDTNKRSVGSPQGCGADQVCLLEQSGSDAKTTELVAVDVKERTVRWRMPAPNAENLVSAGDRVLATSDTTTTNPRSALFDPDGKQLLAEDDRGTFGARVNPASLLLFSSEPSEYPENVALTGVTADGGRRPLGLVEKLRTGSCSWSTSYLTCATAAEFRVWRFTT